MSTKLRFLTVAAALVSLAASAQTTDLSHRQYEDNRIYYEAALEKSLLTRGTVAPEYRFQHNGTWYAETKEFKIGDVFYNGRLYQGVNLNIDACKNLLVVKTGIITATDPAYVDYAIIDGQKYVNLRYGDRVSNAPKGFCKVEFEGEISFYSLIQKSIQSSPGYHNGDDIGYFDPDYRDNVLIGTRTVSVDTFFSYSRKFYLVKDGCCYQIKSRSSFLKKFDKTTAKLLKEYASERKLNDVAVPLDLYAREVLAYWRDNLREGAR